MEKINQAVVLPVKDKKSDKSPDFRVTAKVGDKWEEIGACWKKTSEKGAYLSLKFGDHVEISVGTPSWKKQPDVDADFKALTEEKPKAQTVNPSEVPF